METRRYKVRAEFTTAEFAMESETMKIAQGFLDISRKH